MSRCAAAKSYLVSLNGVIFSPLSTYMLGQSGPINMLRTFSFSQSSSITVFLIPDLTFSTHRFCHSSYSYSDMQTQLALHLFVHCVVGVLTLPLHIPAWAPTRSLLSRSPYV